MKAFNRFGSLAVCMMLSGCATAWTSAVKASPACYQITPANIEAVASEVYAAVNDIANLNAIGAVEQIIANEHVDYETALCIYRAVENQIANPKGGEAAYVPPPGAGTDSIGVETKLPLERAVAMTPQQTTALERIHELQGRAQAAAGGAK